MQSLSVHGTIGILRTHKSIDAFANTDADANAQWEQNLRGGSSRNNFFDVTHYVAASTRCRFLPYSLITIQNWCHLYCYSTQSMCIQPFCIDVQWGMNLQRSGIRTQVPWMNIHSWVTEFWFIPHSNIHRNSSRTTGPGNPAPYPVKTSQEKMASVLGRKFRESLSLRMENLYFSFLWNTSLSPIVTSEDENNFWRGVIIKNSYIKM